MLAALLAASALRRGRVLLPVMGLVAPVVIAFAPPAAAATVTCTLNGGAVSGSEISGTDGDDTLRCPAIPEGVSIDTGAGNDTIAINTDPDLFDALNNGLIGNDGVITGGTGDDTITVRGGNAVYGGKAGAVGNNRELYGGGGNDTITVTGGHGQVGINYANTCQDGGHGGIGNDGTINSGGKITVIGGNGGLAGEATALNNRDCDGGHGGDGNNDRIIGTRDSGNEIIVTGGAGGHGEQTGEGGDGGIGNDGKITVTGSETAAPVTATGGKGGTGGSTGGDGGEGGDGNNRRLEILSGGQGVLRGGDGGTADAVKDGKGGKGNDGRVTADPPAGYAATDGAHG